MSLTTRIARLEDDGRDRRQRCRWCTPLVIYPIMTLRGLTGQIVPPSCEHPAACPGPARVRVYLPERRTA